jgi:heme/copper-type cytochrome/quinol oxidase subunit 2
MGIDENGFGGRVRDWLKANLPMIMVLSGSIVAVVAFALLASMILRLRRQGDANGSKPTETETTAEDQARPR